jgi:hypothetical protein
MNRHPKTLCAWHEAPRPRLCGALGTTSPSLPFRGRLPVSGAASRSVRDKHDISAAVGAARAACPLAARPPAPRSCPPTCKASYGRRPWGPRAAHKRWPVSADTHCTTDTALLIHTPRAVEKPLGAPPREFCPGAHGTTGRRPPWAQWQAGWNAQRLRGACFAERHQARRRLCVGDGYAHAQRRTHRQRNYSFPWRHPLLHLTGLHALPYAQQSMNLTSRPLSPDIRLCPGPDIVVAGVPKA